MTLKERIREYKDQFEAKLTDEQKEKFNRISEDLKSKIILSAEKAECMIQDMKEDQ